MKAVRWKLLKLSCQTQSVDKVQLWPWPLVPKMYRSSHHPASMYEIWKVYVENYSSYRVRTKVLTKFSCDLDLLTPECIGVFLSPSFIYVWYMKAVCWKLLNLSCQNQSFDQVQLWPRPFDPKMYRYFPLTILHLCMKYNYRLCCVMENTEIWLADTRNKVAFTFA